LNNVDNKYDAMLEDTHYAKWSNGAEAGWLLGD